MKKVSILCLVSNPRIVITLILLEVLRHEKNISSLQILFGFLVLSLSAFVWIFAKDPNHFSFKLASSRIIRYVNLAALFTYMISLLVTVKEPQTIATLSVILLATATLLLIALLMKYKASAHIAYMTVGLFALSVSPVLIPSTLLPIAYSRYRAQKHTPSQLLIGFLVAILSTVAVTSFIR